jgi:pilus assembly protein Flp/PilA
MVWPAPTRPDAAHQISFMHHIASCILQAYQINQGVSMNGIAKFVREEDGAAAVEYGLLVALIAAVIVVVVATLGTKVKAGFTTVCNALKGGTGACT